MFVAECVSFEESIFSLNSALQHCMTLMHLKNNATEQNILKNEMIIAAYLHFNRIII